MAEVAIGKQAESVLEKLGLSEELLREVVRRGERWRNSTTPHHPRTAPGWYAWSETTTALRDVLVPLGGAVSCDDGFERCVCPGGHDEIAVVTGDRCTGDPTQEPQPRYTKPRSVAQEAIARSQMSMFAEDVIRPKVGRRLWFLLLRRQGATVVSELSRPGSMTDSGRINAWEKRVILSPVDVGSGIEGVIEPDPTDPVDIDVVPRKPD